MFAHVACRLPDGRRKVKDALCYSVVKEQRGTFLSFLIALTTEEWRLMIESLNNLRNRFISEGKYTDAVDEVLIKVANAKTKKFKITERRV